MNISPLKLPSLLAEEARGVGLEEHGVARLLEFKIVTPDKKYHGYVQMLIIRDARRIYGLWRKFKANFSLTKGETLWEETAEYDHDLVLGSVKMIEERIEDLADRANVSAQTIALSLEMSRSISIDCVSRTRDSRHSFLVRISQRKKHRQLV